MTILFEAGTILQSAAFGSSTTGAINCTSHSYITVDGGSNGIIRNTANGTSLPNRRASLGVAFTNCDNAIIKNLSILTLYVHAQDVNDAAGEDSNGINIKGSNNILITNNTITDAATSIGVSANGGTISNIEISFNNMTNCNRCIVAAVTTDTLNTVLIHDNDFGGGAQLWDQPNNAFHHNAVHAFNTTSGHINGLQLYNNYVHGVWGEDPVESHSTSMLFAETLASTTPVYIYNNLFVAYSVISMPTNGIIFCKINTGNCHIYGNTFIGLASGPGGLAVGCNSPQSVTVKNNIIKYFTVYDDVCTHTASGTNYNDYFDTGSFAFNSFAAWKALGYDANSMTSNPNLSGSYKLQAGSPAIAAGVNLTSLGLTNLNSDRTSTARPSSGGWDIGAFQFVALGPVLTAVNPNSGQQGQANLAVSLTGQSTNFVQGTTTASFGAGIVVNSVTVANATSATANITIAAGAAVGVRNVTLTTGAQLATATNGFTVTAAIPPPALATVNPSSGQQGQANLAVTLTGQFTNFVNGTTTASFGAGITVNSVTAASATSATANLTISAGAAVGVRNVTVTTGAQVVTATNGFTVTAGAPLLTTVNPSSGQQGQANLSVSLAGQFTNFVQGTTTTSFGAGITVNGLTVASATSATANITITAGAAVGTRNVSVTTGTEVVTATNGFTVNAATPTPVLTTVNPNSGQQGQANLVVNLTGQSTNFVNGTTTAGFGAGITVSSVTVATATNATANITISAGAAVGTRNVTVTTGGEVVTVTNGFTVTAGTPVLTAVNPPSSEQGTTLPVMLTGQFTNFANGTTTASFGTGITVNGVTVASLTSATANISILHGAVVGARTVTVTTGGELVTLTNGFTVTALDTTPPTVFITTPASGRIVFGTITVSADATDNVGIVGVQFKVDGANLAPEVTMLESAKTASIQWNTATKLDGPHTLTAVAKDVGGNPSSPSDVTVNVGNKPTTDISISADGGESYVTTDTTGTAVNIAHARIHPNSPSPSGVAIMALRKRDDVLMGDVLVTEAGVPASSEILSGRVYVEISPTVRTGVALSNSTSQDASVSFWFTNRDGVDSRFGLLTLPANSQVSGFLDEARFNGPPVMQEGTFTFVSSVPLGAIALRGFTNERGDFLITTLPTTPTGAGSGQTTAILPHFADGGGWTTHVILTNNSDVAQSGTLRFFGQGSPDQGAALVNVLIDGVSNSTFSYSIPPHAARRFVTSVMSTTIESGSVRITPDVGNVPAAVAILSFRNAQTTVSEVSVSALSADSGFRVYLESSGVFGQVGSIESGVAIANPSSTTPASVILQLTKLDGTSVGLPAPVIVTVPAGGQVAKFINQLFPGISGIFRGIGRLTASSPIAVTALRGRYNERGDFLITTTPPLSDANASSSDVVVFPHIVSGGGPTGTWFTELILFGQATSGRLWLLSQDGALKPSSTLAGTH